MTVNNLREFPLATEQPQPASVPWSTFKHACRERDAALNRIDALEAECAQLAAVAIEPQAGQPTPGEIERAEALLSEALQWQYADEPDEALEQHWGETFASVPRAVLCVASYMYTCGVSDTRARRGQTARGWWTPGRVALLVALLAVVAIVIAGR